MANVTLRPAATRYATVAIVLHWTIAALIIVQVVLAGRMEGRTPEAFALVQLHKSVGITVLLLSLARLAWRLLNPPPPEPPTLEAWEKRLATAVHWAFYVVMIGMPLSGWIMVSTSRLAFPTLLYGVVPWPHLPGLPELAAPAKAAWHEAGEAAHGLIIKGAYVLIALHVGGALKHQLFSRDEPILSRMAPGARGGRWLEPRLLAIVLGLIAVIAFGRFIQPPASAMPARPPAPVAAVAPEPVAAVVTTPADPTVAAAWKVEPGSQLTFATAWSGQAIKGRFQRWSADIRFSPEALDRSRVSVTIDMASADTGDAQRDTVLPSGDWFDTARNPRAVFVATRFDEVSEGRFIARGRLTLRGVSHPLDLPFRLKIVGDRAEVTGVTSLDRTAFGVGQGEWKSSDQIPAKVTVRLALTARRM